MLAKAFRLRQRRDFSRAYQRGRSLVCPAFVLYGRRSGNPTPRVGFSVSKKVGNAVVRNRIKRRFRHAAHQRLDRFRPGWDYVFVVRKAAENYPFAKLGRDLDQALRDFPPPRAAKPAPPPPPGQP